MGYSIKGPSMWVYPKRYDITERGKRRGTVPAFKAHDLWGVLACRLYLKVTMLSEIEQDKIGWDHFFKGR